MNTVILQLKIWFLYKEKQYCNYIVRKIFFKNIYILKI